jgi:EAL domain-containing protein (putative c-di-GMP-specific phosphodiesterase class I)
MALLHSGRLRKFFPAGKVIYRAGAVADSAFVIVRGRVELVRQNGKTRSLLASLGEGEIFGELALLARTKRDSTAIAVDPTELFVADQELLLSCLDRAEPVLELIILALLDRLRDKAVVAAAETKPGASFRRRRAISEFETEHALKRAIADNRMVLHFQPMVHLASGRVVGLEALARWRGHQDELVAPAHFVDLAERSRFIRELDLWALDRACALLNRLDKALGPEASRLFVSVNLSAVHFNDRVVVDEVAAVLARQQTDPSRVSLEITENALIPDIETAGAILSDFKEIGVRVALDDFGTGYSSLRYLHRLRVDGLKLDKTFITGIDKDPVAVKLVQAIIALADSVNLPVVAEGIDGRGQVAVLTALGVEYGQGFYFSKALPADAAEKFVRGNFAKLSGRVGKTRKPSARKPSKGAH